MAISISIAALLLSIPALAAEPAVTSLSGGQQSACSVFKLQYPQQTFYPNTSGYTYETQSSYWSATTFNGPACVFVPQTAQQMSFAVTTMTLTRSKFAVRGGGHMPILGYNGVDSSGVLLSSSNLTSLTLSSDQTTVSVGPGNRWRDVYSLLAPRGLAAVGGRVGHVGVPGLLLGGGISFFSSQYGFASDNVVKYQCILASGLIVEATATNAYSDLFWALRGGGNSFCLVTRFDLKTVVSSKVWVGIAQFDESQAKGYLDGVYNFGKYGAPSDPKAAIIPTILTFPSANLTVYAAAKFYDSLTNSPTAFENFTAPRLTPVADSYALQPLSDYISVTDALQPNGLRQAFRVISSVVNREAVQEIHDTFISEVAETLAAVPNIQASITFQPVTKDFLQHSINSGGNPQGVDPSKAPYFWMVENWTWDDAAYDAIVQNAADNITSSINKLLEAGSWEAGYLYMNDAGYGQRVFQSYPAANLQKLKTIRTKYDPLRIYSDLMPGGWKVVEA
ncbi:FAD-binding domain-containing protein [Dothidotthia symphoricarpi CBS 119687]|uniref:FAD-binding domain-containing protein n=1 Tax=Dothidotthia symphoricarpi CBS 119687 TaxID=1392245 RepID=A0A6A6AMT8_9PLEO|nr:FAD-binding domain-containing protein [Dothidotthia symphoricarpi CBS 119687]KAF2132493.1 FAD-binding domain-containing protein [Dothidotthia symphoricarpi CBS 119687]